MFNYYKEVAVPVFGVLSPPVAVDCTGPVSIMETFCPDPGTGVEWDWLNFYWLLRSDGGSGSSRRYSYADFEAVYKKACGGVACNQAGVNQVSFSRLVPAANAVFGAGSAKAQFWIDSGAINGVDNIF